MPTDPVSWSVEFATPKLRDGVEQLIDAATPGLVERLAVDPAAYDTLVAVHAVAATQAEALLRDAVFAARHAGRTWSQVAEAMGVTRLEAQQRFAASPARTDPSQPAPAQGALEPVDSAPGGAIDAVGVAAGPLIGERRRLKDQKWGEDDALNHFGEFGWKLTSAQQNKDWTAANLSIELTGTRWEYESTGLGRRKRMEADGWTMIPGTRWTGYVYWLRPGTGPVRLGNPDPAKF